MKPHEPGQGSASDPEGGTISPAPRTASHAAGPGTWPGGKRSGAHESAGRDRRDARLTVGT